MAKAQAASTSSVGRHSAARDPQDHESEVNVMRVSIALLVRSSVATAALAVAIPSLAQNPAPTPAPAQQASQSQMPRDELVTFAKVQVAISTARDSTQAQLAQAGNKKGETLVLLREKLQTRIQEILHHSGMTEADYERKTYIVSTDVETRKTFDAIVAELTGTPTPGQVAASGPRVPVPAGPVGTHIGHVVNSFNDTPNGQGLLPVAIAEARVAAQHAALASRAPGNLAGLKTHVGHVLNALDPSIVASGPGQGYGARKAALGVATHIELAAKTQGASQNVITHANHVATSARNTVQRVDSIIVLAKQVQAATEAAPAAALVNQIVSLTEQLIAGFDANGDGRVTWEAGEGGLQHAEQHVNLLLAAEMKPPK